jgi:hypothetical protein
LDRLSIEQKTELYSKNYIILVNEIIKYTKKNIRNNIYNSDYEITTLRKAIKRELDSLIKSDRLYIDQIIHYKPNSSSSSTLIKSVSIFACARYREFMLEKYPHLNKKPKPKHHSRLSHTHKKPL